MADSAQSTPATNRQPWLRAAVIAGAWYFVIGRIPVPGTLSWRLSAWIASGVVFAIHIWYEHVRLRHPPMVTALHTACAVAIGGFTLALAGGIRSLFMTGTLKPLWIIALVAWPAVTAVPGFIAAFVVATVLTRLPRSQP